MSGISNSSSGQGAGGAPGNSTNNQAINQSACWAPAMPPLVLQSSLAALSIADHQAAAVKPDPPLPWKIPGGQFASIVGRGYQPMARVHNPNDVGHRRFTAKENANKQMIRFHPCKHAVVAICNDTIEEMDTSE